jgi:hypothetical protein
MGSRLLALALPLLAGVSPVDVGSRLELFVDDRVVDSTTGIEFRQHEPRPAGVALLFDRPWEGNSSGYATIFRDGDRYRMYYRGSAAASYLVPSLLRPGERPVPDHEELTCYAESRDGKTWTRPEVGIYAFQGSKANNIVWSGTGAHNLAPFRDERPGIPEDERYKATGSGKDAAGKPVLYGFASPDGLHWRQARPEPIITDGVFDSQNVAFWDPLRTRYVAIYRDFRSGVRSWKYSTSDDFYRWEPGQWCDFGDTPLEHFYTNATVSYVRAPHIYLAFPRRFVPWRKTPPDSPTVGVSDAVLVASRDGLHWNRRFLEAFIRPGLDERNWLHRSNTPARGVIETGPAELSMYVFRDISMPSHYLERLTLRTDGFVSARAGYKGGELVTKPLLFTGSSLVVNYSTSAVGSLRVELEDADGRPLAGFGLEDCPPMYGDRIEQTVVWPHATAGPASAAGKFHRTLAGTPVRVRFVLRDADLYSFRFR